MKNEPDIEEFIKWRSEVDSEGVLDSFDLALAWFSAKGCSHDEAVEIARTYQRKMELLKLPGY